MSSAGVLSPLRQFLHDALGAAGFRDDADHATQGEAENQNRGVVRIRQSVNQVRVDGLAQCRERVEVVQEQAAQPNATEQGDQHLTSDEGEGDGKNRGQQAQETG